MNLFNFYKKDESEELKKIEIFNELRDLIKSSNSFTYYHIYNFYILNIDYVSIKDLFQYMIFYGNMNGLNYLKDNFYQNGNINAIDLFYPFYSYILNSITNINNLEMYQYILDNFPNIKPNFYDIILAINYGNIDILQFFINSFSVYEPNEEELKELKDFNIKEFLENVKRKKDVSYIRLTFDFIHKSNFLQNLIIKHIGTNVDYNIISKKYFIEGIMKSIIDVYSFHNETEHNYTISTHYNYI
jgi:hypothetical protein